MHLNHRHHFIGWMRGDMYEYLLLFLLRAKWHRSQGAITIVAVTSLTILLVVWRTCENHVGELRLPAYSTADGQCHKMMFFFSHAFMCVFGGIQVSSVGTGRNNKCVYHSIWSWALSTVFIVWRRSELGAYTRWARMKLQFSNKWHKLIRCALIASLPAFNFYFVIETWLIFTLLPWR